MVVAKITIESIDSSCGGVSFGIDLDGSSFDITTSFPEDLPMLFEPNL